MALLLGSWMEKIEWFLQTLKDEIILSIRACVILDLLQELEINFQWLLSWLLHK